MRLVRIVLTKVFLRPINGYQSQIYHMFIQKKNCYSLLQYNLD